MQTDKSIPYPRPDYGDPDLMSKELVNGTFALGILDDVKHFRPVMDRYGVTEEKLVERTLLGGGLRPEDYDIALSDVTLDGIKEKCWLPAKRVDGQPKSEEVYYPAKHYVYVEWQGVNYKEVPNIVSDNHTGYALYDPYWDDDDPGLFGFIEHKDDNGNIVDLQAAFFSLKTETLTPLGYAPDGFDRQAWQSIGYVKDGYVLSNGDGSYISFLFDGSVRFANHTMHFVTLGDDGCFAVEDTNGTDTVVLDASLSIVDRISGLYCEHPTGLVSGLRRYPFGMKIGGAYYYPNKQNGSNKFWKSKYGWKAKHVESDIWMYQKKIHYDYATDNWQIVPLKSLKYNTIKHGIFAVNRWPHKRDEKLEFVASDMYGDFCRVTTSTGKKRYLHTFDFRKWSELTGDGATHLYGCFDRFWIKDRADGIVGMMPYGIGLKDVDDLSGDRKTVFQFSGFVFRG